LKIVVDPGAYAPTRAHPTDAGLDLRAKEDGYVSAKSCKTFATGVHVQLPKGTVGLICSRSGLNIISGITSTGVIDEGYTGEIKVNLINHSNKGYRVFEGEKISQLVILPVLYEEVEIVEELEESERGENGFGSTGRS